MIYERFRLWMILWSVERLVEHFLHQLKVWSRVESRVKREKWSAELEAVTCQLQLVHGVDVLHGELDRGTLR